MEAVVTVHVMAPEVAETIGMLARKATEEMAVTKLMARQCCLEKEEESRALEIVAGYLAAASDDVMMLANELHKPFVNMRIVQFLMEQAAASHARYRRAQREWIQLCAV